MSPRIGLLAVLAAVALVGCGGGEPPLRTLEGDRVALPGKWPEQDERRLFQDLYAGGFLRPGHALCMMEEIQGKLTLDEYRRSDAAADEEAEHPIFGPYYYEAFENCVRVITGMQGG